MNENECSLEQCDIFDFMAHHVGMSVLHPGGLAATRELATLCEIGPGTRVLDIACGKGTSATLLARQYGCDVTGVDISEELISQAERFARSTKVRDRVRFKVGDAMDLPLPDDEFDVCVSQAMLGR